VSVVLAGGARIGGDRERTSRAHGGNVVWSAVLIVGEAFTVNVNACVGGREHPVGRGDRDRERPTRGSGCRPASRWPSPLSVKLTPAGTAPVSVIVIEVGCPPVVVTVKLPATPSVNAAWLALVMAGGSLTVNVNDCVASGATPFDALIVTVYTPPLPTFGVPASVAVPSPLSVKLTPDGRVPVWSGCSRPAYRQ